MKSPAFSTFRNLIDTWDKSGADLKVKALLQDNGLVLFFKKEGSIYGAPEGSRVTFAKMKSDDEDMPDGWKDEAGFMAFNLTKALKGVRVQSVFSIKDLKEIKIIDQDEAEKLLSKKVSGDIESDLNDDKDDFEPPTPDDAADMDKIGETWRPVPSRGFDGKRMGGSIRSTIGPVTIAMYQDSDTREFAVRYMVGRKVDEPKTYFTDDFQDAMGTMDMMARQLIAQYEGGKGGGDGDAI